MTEPGRRLRLTKRGLVAAHLMVEHGSEVSEEAAEQKAEDLFPEADGEPAGEPPCSCAVVTKLWARPETTAL